MRSRTRSRGAGRCGRGQMRTRGPGRADAVAGRGAGRCGRGRGLAAAVAAPRCSYGLEARTRADAGSPGTRWRCGMRRNVAGAGVDAGGRLARAGVVEVLDGLLVGEGGEAERCGDDDRAAAAELLERVGHHRRRRGIRAGPPMPPREIAREARETNVVLGINRRPPRVDHRARAEARGMPTSLWRMIDSIMGTIPPQTRRIRDMPRRVTLRPPLRPSRKTARYRVSPRPRRESRRPRRSREAPPRRLGRKAGSRRRRGARPPARRPRRSEPA